jgi:esterase/lipase
MPDLFKFSVPSFLIKYKFNNLDKIKKLVIPVLIIHSTEDEMIDFNNSKKIFFNISGEKKLIEITGSHEVGFYNSFDDKKEEIKSFLNK